MSNQISEKKNQKENSSKIKTINGPFKKKSKDFASNKEKCIQSDYLQYLQSTCLQERQSLTIFILGYKTIRPSKQGGSFKSLWGKKSLHFITYIEVKNDTERESILLHINKTKKYYFMTQSALEMRFRKKRDSIRLKLISSK